MLQSKQTGDQAVQRRDLNRVQRMLRTLIWLGSFIVLAGITLLLAFALPLGLTGATVILVIGGLLSLIIPGMIIRCLYVIPEFRRVVILKMGKFNSVQGPGKLWVIPYPPFYQSVAAVVDMRVKTRVIQAAQTLTADNVPVGCEAVVFWRVEDPKQASLAVSDYAEAVFQAANSALKDTVGSLELSELLGERDKIANQLEQTIDAAAVRFGVDVSSVEITDVHVPADLVQELSVLAQSRRSAQAKIAEADAEKTVAEKLEEAASIMGKQAMEMYRLNVIERIGREEGGQIIVYGLNGSDAALGKMLSASAAGSRMTKEQSKGNATESAP